jgi:hypothetical protein
MMMGRTSEIIKAFGAVQAEMHRELGALDIGEYSEVAAGRTRARLFKSIDALSVYAAGWAKRAVKAQYVDQQARTRTRLELIGAERNRRFDKRRHERAINRSSDAVLKDYMKATAAMKMLVGSYLDSLRRHNASLLQVQEFDATGLGQLADEFIGTLVTNAIANNQARGVVSRTIMAWLRKNLADGNYIQIGNRMYNVRAYSELVARTWMIEASTEAVKQMCSEYGNDLVVFSTHDNPCEECAALEGQIFSISGDDPEYPALTSDVEPPIHPNCVLPGTRCIAPGGIIAGSRALYRGEIIELSFSNGTRLSVTQNHLFLTPNGFAPAYLLREGDDVFYCSGTKRNDSGCPDDNREPTAIEQIIESLSISSGMSRSRMPITAEDFHGDGRFCDGDIDIVFPDSFKDCALESTFLQGRGAHNFIPIGHDGIFLDRLGDFASVLKRLALTADRIVGGSRSPSPFFLARASGCDTMTFADTPKGNVALDEPAMDGLIRNPKFLGKIALQASGSIGTTEVIDIFRRQYFGHVYNLQSPTTLYITNDILSSNCEHNLNPVSRTALSWRGRTN